MKKHNVVFISSTGGHYSQLLQIVKRYPHDNSYIITEKTIGNEEKKEDNFKYFLQQDRRNPYFVLILLLNIIRSISLVIKIRPKVTVTTGAGVVIPFCILTKILGGKLIYIESFAKIHSPTITGKILYKFSDKHYVQWEEMKKHYPNAIYKGALY